MQALRSKTRQCKLRNSINVTSVAQEQDSMSKASVQLNDMQMMIP